MWACWDKCLLIAEWLARQVYWSSPWLRFWVRRRRARAHPLVQVARRDELKRYLRDIGVTEGALVMVHTSVSRLHLIDEPEQPEQERGAPNFLTTASHLVDDLLELVGETGTLVMPSHAHYQAENEYTWPDDSASPTRYDPGATSCGVGLANELFWRRKGVQRSLHPYNTLAAHGPLAAELFRDNLNHFKPLPHGIYSGYYRFCQHDGLVVSIGVPLSQCLTLVHVGEDVRDAEWPIEGFYGERKYIVCIGGRDETSVVRQMRPEYDMFCLCLRKVRRDLIGAGILHEGRVASVRVDWAHSREVFEYLMSRNKSSTYPYYGAWLVQRKRCQTRKTRI